MEPVVTATAASMINGLHDIASVIREHAATNERDRRLAAPVVEAMKGRAFLECGHPRDLAGWRWTR